MTAAGGQREIQAQASTVSGRGGCNLAPLKTLGPFSLRPNIPEILGIRLIEIEVTLEDPLHPVAVLRADDLFEYDNTDRPRSSLIPYNGQLTRAVFAFHFSDSARPVRVEITAAQPPALPTGSDTEPIKRWLNQSGFCE
jgi:hypothetical protein